jgi:hypothetical protein
MQFQRGGLSKKIMNNHVSKGDDNASFEKAVSYIFGRIEHEIECFARGLGVPTEVVAQRIWALLQPSGKGSQDRVPSVQLETEQTHAIPSEMEGAGRASGKRKPSQSRNPVVKNRNKVHSEWWYKLTPAQRKRVIAKRVKTTRERYESLSPKG